MNFTQMEQQAHNSVLTDAHPLSTVPITNATPLSTQLEPLQEQEQEALDTVDESVKLE